MGVEWQVIGEAMTHQDSATIARFGTRPLANPCRPAGPGFLSNQCWAFAEVSDRPFDRDRSSLRVGSVLYCSITRRPGDAFV